jgi:MFS family permease
MMTFSQPTVKDRILYSASLFHAVNDAASVIVPTVFPLLYSRGHLITSYSQIGLLSNLGLLTTFCLQFLVVRVSFHAEYRNLVLWSVLGISASMALLTLSSSFLALLALFILIRVFMSFYHPVIIAWISKSQPAEGLGQAMGIQSGSGNLGVFVAFMTVGYLAEKFDWRTPLLVWSAFGILLGLVSFSILRGISSKETARPTLRISDWMGVLDRIRRLVPGFVFGGLGWSVTVFYAPSLLHHEFSIPMGRTGLYLALWIGLGTFSGYGYGFLSRRLGRRRVFLASLGGGTLSLALIGVAPGRSLAVAGLLLFGVFLLMTYPSLHTYVGSLVPREIQTQAFSWVSNLQMISGALLGLLAGVLSDSFGIRSPFILSAVLSAAAFLYYLRPELRETIGRS